MKIPKKDSFQNLRWEAKKSRGDKPPVPNELAQLITTHTHVDLRALSKRIEIKFLIM